MNHCLSELLEDCNAVTKLVTGLPQAFEMASLELPSGNPAVGFLREHALTGFFRNYFGDKVELPTGGNERGFDIKICGSELSIKTVTKFGKIKVVWTADTRSVNSEISGGYYPTCDILLTRIYWGESKESVFYIPLEAQREIFDNLGSDEYLRSAISTNHRGIEISSNAINLLQNHNTTKKLWVDWQKLGINYTPYDRWEEFWEEIEI